MRRLLRTAALFATLLVFWLVLSARLDPLFLVIGVVSCAAVAWYSATLLDHVLGADDADRRFDPVGLAIYLPWLFARQLVSGFEVAWLVLHPRRGPTPGVFRFRTSLELPAAQTLLANTITLVPGTNTIQVDGPWVTVHAFSARSAADLADGTVQRRVARVFRLPPDEPPILHWKPAEDAEPADQQPDGEVAR